MHQLFVSVAVEVLVALHCAKVATKVLVALCLCIQSCSKGFGGSVSAYKSSSRFLVDLFVCWCNP